MNVTCQTDRDLPAEARKSVREDLARRAEGRFGRFGRRVRAVSARVLDVNGPRGGVDIRCRLAVTLRGGREVIVEETAASVREAVSGAFHRAAHAVSRRLEKARSGRRMAVAEV